MLRNYRKHTSGILSLGPRFNDEDTPADSGEQSNDITSILQNEDLVNQLIGSDLIQSQISSRAEQMSQESVNKLEANNFKLRGQNSKLKDKATLYDQLLQDAQNKAEMDGLANGDFTPQQLIDSRVSAARDSWQKDYDALATEKEEFARKYQELEAQLDQRNLNDFVGKAVDEHPHFRKAAKSHFMRTANDMWGKAEDGNYVLRDGNGNVVMGKNGQPIQPGEWVAGLADVPEFQHYYDFPTGSGARPGANGSAGRVMSKQQFQDAVYNAESDEEEAKLWAQRQSGDIKVVS